MISEKQGRYNYYPEKITKVLQEHELLMPGEEESFARFVRGC